MRIERLQVLERRVQMCRSTQQEPGTPNRDNEPHERWSSSEPDAIDSLIRNGGLRQEATALNMNTCRGQLGGAEPETVTGLDGLVLETFPEAACEAATAIRDRFDDTPSAREIAAEVLDLDETTSRVLFDGPNWAGQARAWIQPHEAAQAVHHVAQGVGPDKVWAHLDRARIIGNHESERPDAYLENELSARVEQWLDHVHEIGHEPETGAKADEISDIDVTVERYAILEQLRERQGWSTIAASAEIDPTAEIGEGVDIGERAAIGAGVVIDRLARVDADASIGDDTRIGAEVVVGERAQVGGRCQIGMSVGEGSRIGDECVLTAGPDKFYLAALPPRSIVPARTVLDARNDPPTPAWAGAEDLAPAPVGPERAPARAEGAHSAVARGTERDVVPQH